MISKIKIENFKSVKNAEFEPGRFNVIIGENGCGKTNILEAISFAGAANAWKLDNEFLSSRGIRNTSPEFMTSAFEDDSQFINITFTDQDNIDTKIKLEHLPTGWYSIVTDAGEVNFIDSNQDHLIEYTLNRDKRRREKPLSKFLIFCPEETTLRRFSDENQIYPLGRRGEGLFQYLKELSQSKEGKEIFTEISEGLSLLDWFDGFNIPENLMSNEYTLKIGDRNLQDKLHYFDQRSTNEGFLYLLFYLTLFSSKQTPSFFAIDNIETSFNPKLCTKVITILADMAKRHNKQVIVTTHNPAVLDGLDLSDDEQRLFVARRNVDGHTKLDRVPYKENRKMNLSELWMSGLIGGLPDNF